MFKFHKRKSILEAINIILYAQNQYMLFWLLKDT